MAPKTKTVEKDLRVLLFEGEFAVPPDMTREEFVLHLFRLGVHYQGIMVDQGIKRLEVDVTE